MNTLGYLCISIVLVSGLMMIGGMFVKDPSLSIAGFILFWVMFGSLLIVAVRFGKVNKDRTSKLPITPER